MRTFWKHSRIISSQRFYRIRNANILCKSKGYILKTFILKCFPRLFWKRSNVISTKRLVGLRNLNVLETFKNNLYGTFFGYLTQTFCLNRNDTLSKRSLWNVFCDCFGNVEERFVRNVCFGWNVLETFIQNVCFGELFGERSKKRSGYLGLELVCI